VAPAGGDEASGWQKYKQVRMLFAEMNRDRSLRVIQILGGVLADGWAGAATERAAVYGLLPPLPVPDEAHAVPFLSLRAARRAIAADRDHPDGYWALFVALNDRELPLSDAERALSQVTALRQCLKRLPPPDQYRPGVYLAAPAQVSYVLANLYLGRKPEFGRVPMGIPINHLALQLLNPQRGTGFLRAAVVPVEGPRGGRPERRWAGAPDAPPGPIFLLPLDEAHELLQLTRKYLEAAPPATEEDARAIQKELDRDIKEVEAELSRMNNAYDRRDFAARGQMKLSAQVETALEYNLVGKALDILMRQDTDLGKEFGPRALEVALSLTALQLAVGRLEDAAAGLDTLTSDPEVQRALSNPGISPVVQMLKFQKLVAEGNYAEAGAVMESLDGRMVGLDPARSLRQQFDPKPFVQSKQPLGRWAGFAQLSALVAPNPLDALTRAFAPLAALDGFGEAPGFFALRENLAATRQRDAEFYTRRGLLSLAEGDIPAARARFLQARPTPEQTAEGAKWGLPEYRNPLAERYLRLIDEAARRAQRK
jgi:hypothetical protein